MLQHENRKKEKCSRDCKEFSLVSADIAQVFSADFLKILLTIFFSLYLFIIPLENWLKNGAMIVFLFHFINLFNLYVRITAIY
jgi:hypothetical protein